MRLSPRRASPRCPSPSLYNSRSSQKHLCLDLKHGGLSSSSRLGLPGLLLVISDPLAIVKAQDVLVHDPRRQTVGDPPHDSMVPVLEETSPSAKASTLPECLKASDFWQTVINEGMSCCGKLSCLPCGPSLVKLDTLAGRYVAMSETFG